MRKIVVAMAMMFCCRGMAATAYWSGISVYNYGQHTDQTRDYYLTGGIHGQNGEFAEILSDMYGHTENGNLFLKHADYSRESMEPTYNWWVLVLYGDIVNEATFDSYVHVEDFRGNDCYTGGTLVENPSDFYMAFKASEVLLENYEYVEGMSWYGWVHVSIDANLEMTLLGADINLTGGVVTVGATPEPSSALLLLVGGALLALRRQKPVSDYVVEIARLAKTGKPPATLSCESCARQGEYLVYYLPSGGCPAFYDKL